MEEIHFFLVQISQKSQKEMFNFLGHQRRKKKEPQTGKQATQLELN